MDWRERIDGITGGYRDSTLLMSAVKSGLLDALGDEWATAGEAAVRAGLDERATGVVLCALTAAGILQQDGNRFRIEPEARPYLLSDSPQTLASIMKHNLSMMQSWAHLTEVLRSGVPARGQERSPDELRDFILGMENVSRRSSVEVAAKLDFTGAKRLLDLGGGPGTAALAFAAEHAAMTCVVYDLAEVVAIAEEQIAAAGLRDRVTTVAGDFQVDPLPGGFDLVYVSNIIHMMGPDETRLLFGKVNGALEPGGRIVVKDFTLEDDLTTPAVAAQFSVNMLVNTRAGKSYARSEILRLLEETGFGSFEIIDVARASQLVCARRGN